MFIFYSQRAEYIRKKKIEVEQSLHSIVQGKQRKNANFEEGNKKNLILEEVNKIQSVSSNNFLSLIPTGISDDQSE